MTLAAVGFRFPFRTAALPMADEQILHVQRATYALLDSQVQGLLRRFRKRAKRLSKTGETERQSRKRHLFSTPIPGELLTY